MQDGNDAVHGAIHGATPGERLMTGMNALLEQRKKGKVFYTQGSGRMTIVRKKLIPPFGSRAIYEDCSSAVTGLYYMAGLHDPNNLHFSGYGYTGTLDDTGKKLQQGAALRIGDLVFYGYPPWHHVAMVYAPAKGGVGVKVWSHGHPGGPVIEPIDYRSDRGQVRRYF